MKTFQLFVDHNNEPLFSNFPLNLQDKNFHTTEKTSIIEVEINGTRKKAKIGNEISQDGKIYILTTEEKYIKSSKLFKDLINTNLIALSSIAHFKKNFSLNQNEYVQGLIHNLTSLNTYNIQDLNSLIPQQVLAQNFTNQHDVIKKIISEQPKVTVDTLLKLIKYNYAMKVEFSVFEKTVMKTPIIQKIESPIRDIVLSIIQIFIDEFEELKIIVSVDSNFKLLFVDYDSLFVSLYYLLENAIKYCSPKSKFKIHFKEEQQYFYIVFDMLSIRIEDDEVTKLCTKNFRSKNAIQLTEKGKGIGMHRILKTLRLNHAELEIRPRISDFTITRQGNLFEHNEFRIKFDSTRMI